jgi:acyl carrier protein
LKNFTKQELDNFFSDFFDVNIDQLNKIRRGDSFEWDSMKHVDLILQLERVFKIKIKPKQISKIESYKDILDIIKNENK